jgi:methyl-accepting chemotaxis protein
VSRGEDRAALPRAQARAARLLALGAWCLAPLPPLAAHAAGNAVPLALAGGILMAVLAEAALRAPPAWARVAVAQALVGQTALVTAALAGHGWQVDSHMLFFAVLAACVMLVDVRAILLAAGAITLHHVGLSVVLPALVYPAAGLVADLLRSVGHGAILAIETTALVFAVRQRLALDREATGREEAVRAALEAAEAGRAEAERAGAEAAEARALSEEASRAAEQALADLEAETGRARNAAEAARAAEAREAARIRESAERQEAVVAALREGLGRLARGDLSVSLEGRFEDEFEDLGRDFETTVRSLQQAIGDVGSRTRTITAEVDALAAAADSLARRTERQAATLEEISAAVTELAESTGGAAQNAGTARDLVTRARGDAESGVAVMAEAMGAMERIEKASRHIHKVTEVIDHIAFQTNLLALNAGVEAARAGDAGRGFAVVAAEVRGLAQRSSEAASEINQLIVDSEAQVKEGVRLVGETGTALGEIKTAVTDIARRVTEIATSSEEQSVALTEINTALAELDSVTQHNAAMFEEATASSQILASNAAELAAAMERFATAPSTVPRAGKMAPAVPAAGPGAGVAAGAVGDTPAGRGAGLRAA